MPRDDLLAEIRENMREQTVLASRLDALQEREILLMDEALRSGTSLLAISYAVSREFGCADIACIVRLRRRLTQRRSRARRRRRR